MWVRMSKLDEIFVPECLNTAPWQALAVCEEQNRCDGGDLSSGFVIEGFRCQSGSSSKDQSQKPQRPFLYARGHQCEGQMLS